MRCHYADLEGAYIIELEKLEDSRGFFARIWCQQEFEDHGLVPVIARAKASFNVKAGTLRGMHYQVAPYEETKLVRCTRGALYDVIVDLRPDSSPYKRWIGVELTASNYRMLYVPGNFAHGFITLEDDTEVSYLVSESYRPGAEGGLRWDDPEFNIKWPRPVKVMSDKDARWPDFAEKTSSNSIG